MDIELEHKDTSIVMTIAELNAFILWIHYRECGTIGVLERTCILAFGEVQLHYVMGKGASPYTFSFKQ